MDIALDKETVGLSRFASEHELTVLSCEAPQAIMFEHHFLWWRCCTELVEKLMAFWFLDIL